MPFREPTFDEEKRTQELWEDKREAMEIFVQGAESLALGHREQALDKLNQAIKLAPHTPEFLDGKTECLCTMRRFQEALECAKSVTWISPSFVSGWINRSWAAIEAGDLEDGLRSAEKAISLNNTYDMAWNNKGLALMRMGNNSKNKEHYRNAIEAFDNALRINPTNSPAHQNKTICLNLLKHSEED